MPTSVSKYNASTTGHQVVETFSDHVKDKIILITGANPGGVGGQSAISLAAASPKLLILAGRSQAKLEGTVHDVKKVNPDVAVKTLILDLSSQKSCREAATKVMDDADIPQIDILINNAGVMAIPERTLSPEGIEMQFATNHIGHFLFTNLIREKLVAAARTSTRGAVRIVNLSSWATNFNDIRFSDYNFTKLEVDLPEEERLSPEVRQAWQAPENGPYSPAAAYGQSKTANVLFSLGLNKHWLEKDGIVSIAVHPGGVDSQVGRRMTADAMKSVADALEEQVPGFKWKDLDEGCSTQLVAALDPKVQADDLLFSDCQVADWTPSYAKDVTKADRLWKLSEELVGQSFT